MAMSLALTKQLTEECRETGRALMKREKNQGQKWILVELLC